MLMQASLSKMRILRRSAADPAGGDVGDAAIGEQQPRVNVSVSPLSTGTPTVSTRQRRGHHVEDEIDVVDHQVEHHVDVGAATAEGRDALPSMKSGRRTWRRAASMAALQRSR